MEESVTTVSKILKAERKRLGLTQGELAVKLDCTQQNLSEIERGESHPSEKLLDRMIELFGPGSPITYVGRKGEAHLPPPKPSKAQMLLSKVSDFVDVANEYNEATIDAAVKIFTDKRVESEIVAALPPEYRVFWKNELDNVDYVSPTLVAEVKMVKRLGTVKTTARLGMQQLCVARAKLGDDRLYDLILLLKETEAMNSQEMLEVSVEAKLLNITMVFCSGPEGVAKTILMQETGRWRRKATEEDDESY